MGLSRPVTGIALLTLHIYKLSEHWAIYYYVSHYDDTYVEEAMHSFQCLKLRHEKVKKAWR
jgi:hypothetical protein